MRNLVRFITVVGAVGALVPLSATASQAASTCVTASNAYNWGVGEISLCPQSDGTYHVTGWTDDLLPGDWFAPDGACVGWAIYDAKGLSASSGWNCAQFHPERPTKLAFDYVTTFRAPVTDAKLSKGYF